MIDEPQIDVYPNPAQNFVTVKVGNSNPVAVSFYFIARIATVNVY